MRFVLTNDDGIDALGIGWLARLAAERGVVAVVAPHEEQSGVGHRVNVRQPLRLEEQAADRYAVSGSPADCVRVALRALNLEADWVLSGLNHGGNLGADLSMSGTVAAAREAALLGCQAIALSQILNRAHALLPAAVEANLRRVLALLLEKPLPRGQFYNVNLPSAPDVDEPEIVFCRPDPSPHDVRFRREGASLIYEGVFLQRPRLPLHDVDVAFGGKIAVSVLSVV